MNKIEDKLTKAVIAAGLDEGKDSRDYYDKEFSINLLTA